MITPPVFVIHVRGDTVRESYITSELKRHGIDFEFISDGNIEDLSPDIMRNFFEGPIKNDLPAMSCAYKHLLACQKLLDKNIPHALILEDDIDLSGSFEDTFNKSIVEAQALRLKGYLISYESSGHKYVPRSERRPGKILYRKPHGRCAGAYLIDASAAERILRYTMSEKFRQNIDWHHNEMADKGLLEIYWCHPAVAEQQSHNGKLPSLLDGKKRGILRRISYALQKLYRRFIFFVQ